MSPTVRDAMSMPAAIVRPHAKIAEITELLKRHGIRHLPVVDDGGVVIGIVTRRDLASRALGPISWLGQDELERQVRQVEAREVMTAPVVTVAPDVALAEAARILVDRGIDGLPVVEDGRLVGMLTEGDFVRIVAGIKRLPG